MSGNGKILVVDDEEMIRKVVIKMLVLKDFEPLEASSGEEALELLQNEENVEYVILDLSMPGMSGKEVFNKIKSNNPEIKIIIATGYISTDEADEFIASGAFGILEKPFKMDQLFEKVT